MVASAHRQSFQHLRLLVVVVLVTATTPLVRQLAVQVVVVVVHQLQAVGQERQVKETQVAQDKAVLVVATVVVEVAVAVRLVRLVLGMSAAQVETEHH